MPALARLPGKRVRSSERLLNNETVSKWTAKAVSDLSRLYEFLASADERAAERTVRALARAPKALLTNPRIGEQLFQFEDREVRRILVGRYEMRYEVVDEAIFVLRLWHTREER